MWTKNKLIELYKELSGKLGRPMTKKEWNANETSPSDMPIRVHFKRWNNFIIECGYKPYSPHLSELAQKNKILAHKGKRGCAWKGGRIKDNFGYIQIWKPDHPNCKSAGYIHEHRLVMSEFLGRQLQKNENIHHKNGIRDDNRIENLELWTKSQPSGQRKEDLISSYILFLEENGYKVERKI